MNALKNEQKERITIYCDTKEQQENIRNKLQSLRMIYGNLKNCDVIEYLVNQEYDFLKNNC